MSAVENCKKRGIEATAERVAFCTSKNVPLTILVVEDDPIIRVIVCSMLEDMGHACIEAKSAECALDVLAIEKSIDLVVTDHSMQGMTGGQLIEIIKRDYTKIPAILATGNPINAAGIEVAVLHKPFFQEDLERAIEETMANNRKSI
ncbi:response regulator [Pseudomonas stutzeri]|nr:response regulator [Stutzerimonas stutzeri]